MDGTAGSTQERQDTVHFSLHVLCQATGLEVDGGWRLTRDDRVPSHLDKGSLLYLGGSRLGQGTVETDELSERRQLGTI